jgi:hypothetical protein
MFISTYEDACVVKGLPHTFGSIKKNKQFLWVRFKKRYCLVGSVLGFCFYKLMALVIHLLSLLC